MSKKTTIHNALLDFSQAVTAKMSQLTLGEPEDQLRAPFETFMAEAAQVFGWNAVCTGETPLPDRLGRPDYAVHLNKLLAGYVELKAPGVGAKVTSFKGHNLDQWKRFSSIPNILYSDGNEWGLYRDGKLVGKIVRLTGDVSTDGKKTATPKDANTLEPILRDFLSWEPFIPKGKQGNIDLKGFAELLAPLCRMLRDDVIDALQDQVSPLVQLAKDWRQLLFPDAPDEQFADAYAQTVTFAMLLGRSEGADPMTLETAQGALAAKHNLLSRALQVLTDPKARTEMTASLDLLLRVIAAVPPATFTGPEDPWLYFYEDFLAIYDPKLRKNAGIYYTPIEVVRAQVRLIDNPLVNRLNKPLGFADTGVVTLDPATGTGTYLLGVIEHALRRIKEEQGPGAVAAQATELAKTLYGVEVMVGPDAVTELRVSRALRDQGGELPKDGIHVYLTDTLESPNAKPQHMPLYLKPIAEQHEKALNVKSKVPVIICLGNPPYDRHDAVDTAEDNLSPYGGWVRFGDALAEYSKKMYSKTYSKKVSKKDSKKNSKKKKVEGKYREIKSAKARLEMREKESILRDFIGPAIASGHGVHIKNLYNLYVYFWRWAIWKVFEHETTSGPGVVSFISASSYINGDAFAGMREHMRRQCDEIWILDLGGEGRGTRPDENIFAIQTPVAIAVALRSGKAKTNKPAKVHYTRIQGTRKVKLSTLDAITDFNSLKWQDCPNEFQAPFRPAGKGHYFDWPLLTDLMPWQHSGIKAGRTWVISAKKETLVRRWQTLIQAEKPEKKKLFKDSPTGRKVHQAANQLPPSNTKLKPITELPKGSSPTEIIRFTFRSFDRQFIFADARLLDRPGPVLWRAHSEKQVYITSLLNHPLGQGPALTSCSNIPDLHHFRGSYGAKEVFPLFRNSEATETNFLPGLLKLIGTAYKSEVKPENFLAYLYGILAQPTFTALYTKELVTRELHVPITKNAKLFEKVRKVGARLLWLHTFGERFIPQDKQQGNIPSGKAKCKKAVSSKPNKYPESFDYNNSKKTLTVGEGEFAPVTQKVYEFDVSGLKVVQSWLKYRMKKGAGKKSSCLDNIRPDRWTGQFTTELLELLWVLEATVADYPKQAKLLGEVVKGPCFQADEIPSVPKEMRKAPATKTFKDPLFAGLEEE